MGPPCGPDLQRRTSDLSAPSEECQALAPRHGIRAAGPGPDRWGIHVIVLGLTVHRDSLKDGIVEGCRQGPGEFWPQTRWPRYSRRGVVVPSAVNSPPRETMGRRVTRG